MISEQKLLDIYKNACKYFYEKKKNLIHKSLHWERVDSKKFNLENLKKFRNNSILSSDFDDTSDTFSFRLFRDVVQDTSEEYVLKNLPKENIGNSNYLIKYKNSYFNENKLIQISWFSTLEKTVLKKNKISTLCEIGGGYGSFAEIFINNYDVKLFSIDLPETNILNAFYLSRAFPNKKFYLFDDYEKYNFLSYDDFQKNDIIILPPNCNVDEKIKIDFFMNSRSMMEMNFQAIKSYFDFIHSHCHENSFFLNINRYEKNSVGETIRICEYPYDKDWEVVISKQSFNQKAIHFLLTKRNFAKSDIFQELHNIKEIGKKYFENINSKKLKIRKLSIRLIKKIFGIRLINSFGLKIEKFGYRLKKLK